MEAERSLPGAPRRTGGYNCFMFSKRFDTDDLLGQNIGIWRVGHKLRLSAPPSASREGRLSRPRSVSLRRPTARDGRLGRRAAWVADPADTRSAIASHVVGPLAAFPFGLRPPGPTGLRDQGCASFARPWRRPRTAILALTH